MPAKEWWVPNPTPRRTRFDCAPCVGPSDSYGGTTSEVGDLVDLVGVVDISDDLFSNLAFDY